MYEETNWTWANVYQLILLIQHMHPLGLSVERSETEKDSGPGSESRVHSVFDIFFLIVIFCIL